MNSDIILLEIEERWSKSQPGPWKSYIENRDHESGDSFIMTGGEDIYLLGANSFDQDFIAAAKQDIPFLIAEIKKLKAVVSD